VNTRLKLVIGTGAALVVIVAAIIVVGLWLAHRSFPSASGSATLSALSTSVEVRRDPYGVVHIQAQSILDAYRAVGYVHGQDRLWQMELFRRVGEGRLAELVGPAALPVDRLFRTLGLQHTASRIEDILDDETRTAMLAYCEGVNAWIAEAKGMYPIEYDMLGFEPEPWTLHQSILVSRLMAWELDYSRWMDVLMSVFVERFGEDRARDLFPAWDEDAPMVVPPSLRPTPRVVAGLSAYVDAELRARDILGLRTLGQGSNSWAVAGARTVSGKPYLANDPHLMLLTPARFHEIHVTAPGLNVAGLAIPGIPFAIIGRNRSIAWGLTNAMMDDHDFYVERVDSLQHPSKYMMDGVWRPLEIREDTILVKGGAPVLLTIYMTHRGPIVNRIEPAASYSNDLISMRWTGHDIAADAGAFLRLNRASSWAEFRAAVSLFTVPAQNFVYADTSGHIGYQTGGRLPIRNARHALLPQPGWESGSDWTGYVPASAMPSIFDPPQGFIATANNKIIDDRFPYHITQLWEPSWRIRRITEVLSSSPRVTMDDMQRLQLDLVSPLAREVVPVILNVFPDSSSSDSLRSYLTYLRSWDFNMRKEDVSTLLFESTMMHLVRETFEDDMGPDFLAIFDTVASMPMTALERLLRKPTSSWFDDIRTPEVETRDDMIRRSVMGAIGELRRNLGGEMKEWRWERLHTIVFEHAFSSNPLLAPIFNNGPYSVGGAHSTVNVGYYDVAHPFRMTVGASTRQVFDLSNPNNTRSILPPGQSGHVFHSHYDDQVKMWLNGVYRIVPMDSTVVRHTATEVLILEPNK